MKSLLCLSLCLCAIGVARAYDPLAPNDRSDYTPPADSWREDPVTPPRGFDADDLQSFTLNSDRDRFDYAIERGSLSSGDDGVARFVLVIRSRQGTVNSSYEGLHCGHRAYKVYAYGDDQGLTPLPGGDWQPIPKGGSDYRAALYQDLICNLQTGMPNPPAAVFRAMRDGTKVDTPFH